MNMVSEGGPIWKVTSSSFDLFVATSEFPDSVLGLLVREDLELDLVDPGRGEGCPGEPLPVLAGGMGGVVRGRGGVVPREDRPLLLLWLILLEVCGKDSDSE